MNRAGGAQILNLGLHETFGYDNADRLRNWNPTTTASVNYDIGDTGNLTGRHYREQGGAALDEILTYAHPTKPHAITAAPWGAFSYDSSGRQKIRPGQQTVTYTAFDLPEQILQPGGTTTFGYDANHERVFKQSPTKSTTYVGGVYERRVTGSGVTHVFYLPGGEGIAAQVECVETLLEPNCSAPSYLHYDNLGSVDAVTDGSGTTTHHKRDPFGRFFDPTNPSSTVDPSLVNISIGFIGDEEDTDLGLVNLQHRLYDPRAGRFISPDPLVHDPFWGQAHNRYTYALNNPMSFVDPTGLDSTPTDLSCTVCQAPEQIAGGDLFPPDFIDAPPPATGTEGLQRTTLQTAPQPILQRMDAEGAQPSPTPETPNAQVVTRTVAFDATPPGSFSPIASSLPSRTEPKNPIQGVILADNRRDPLFGHNPFVSSYNEDGSPHDQIIPILPILGPSPNVGALEYGNGGFIRFVVALFRFSSAERSIVSEATALLRSPEMAQLQDAYAKGVALTVTIGGRLIQYEPSLPGSGLSAFGANGFLLGPQSFSLGNGELQKTILHELYRLGTSNLSNLAQQLGSMQAAITRETEQAAAFAERAYNAFFK